MSDKKKIKIMSWNVNGLRAVINKDFTKIIHDLDPDILLLQETKLQDPIPSDPVF